MTATLGNIEPEQPGMTIAPSHQLFQDPLQNHVYYDKLAEVKALKAEIKGLQNLIEQAREEINRLRGDSLSQKQEYELKLINQLAEQKEGYEKQLEVLREQDRTKQKEIDNLTRDLNDANNGSTLNGIISKAAAQEGGLKDLLAGGAQLVHALGSVMGRTPALPGAQAPGPALSPQLQTLNQLLLHGSPEDQQAVLELVQAIILKVSKEAETAGTEADVKPFIQNLIIQINGTH